ncbi:Trypsin domain containing protein, partial [Asbolus verrucosus]
FSSIVQVEDETKIVGGFEANKDDYPYVVSLRNTNNNHFCGGTLVDSMHIVTAAHCVIGGYAKYVVVGCDSLDKGGVRYAVISGISHPDYDEKLLKNDIAVLKIAEKASYKSSFPARLRTNLSDYENPCYVAAVQPIHPSECKNEWEELYNSHLICTSSERNAACQGDSGGPLMCENKFSGIVSFGKPCATGKPDVFTAVNSYNDWIDSIMH